MKINTMRFIGSSLISVICLGLLISCGDYSVSLPNGYSLARIYSGAILIHHTSKGVVINANVDRYKVLDEFIVGHVTLAELTPERNYSKPGYFIINTKTNEVKEGLDKQVWLETLKKMKIMSEPDLSKPSRFDRDY